jgi:hypothetical protein
MIYRKVAGAALGKGELKNEGLSHYVIENTYRKNVSFRASHYVYENKRLIFV